MNTRFASVGISVLLFSGLATFGAPDSAAPQMQGAEALIPQLQNLLVASTNAAAAEDPALAEFKAKRAAFMKDAAGMVPDAAANGWLELADLFWKLPAPTGPAMYYCGEDSSQADPLSFAGLIAAVPPPPAWFLLGKKLDAAVPGATAEDLARRTILRAAIAFLDADPQALKTALDSLAAQGANLEDYQRQNLQNMLRELGDWQALLESGSQDIVTRLERQINQWDSDRQSYQELSVPDLAATVGEEKATALLRKAIAVPGLRLEVFGKNTLRLAQQLVLEQMATLPSPQWGLVDSTPTGQQLFKALSARFERPRTEESLAAPAAPAAAEAAEEDAAGEPEPQTPADTIETAAAPAAEPVAAPAPALIKGWNSYGFKSDFQKASATYLSSLLLLNRTEEALQYVLSLDDQDVQECYFTSAVREHSAVPANVLVDFLGQWLDRKPGLPLWDDYIRSAVIAGRTDEALQKLDAIAGHPDLTLAQRFDVGLGKARLFLALDRTNDVLVIWRELAAMDAGKEMTAVQIQIEARKAQLGETWAAAGLALKATTWFDEGLAVNANARARMMQLQPDDYERPYRGCTDMIQQGLLDLGRYAEAEQRVWADLNRQLAIMKAHANPARPENAIDLSSDLERLIEVYDKAGRPADVLALLEKSPGWGNATNLSELSSQLLVPAAAALHAAGRNAEAWDVLVSALAQEPGNDKAYALLVQLPHADLPAFLDQLYARDQFEERPLIWKAALLLQAKQLDAAETVARQALKVDPTDGEQPNGDRVRGYSVLADILAAKGRKADAEFFRNVVKSVRIAEDGDKLNEAGLTTRSLKLYAEAEKYFADAYCVQWRLAERLQALGQTEEAQKHYQIAFERMPEQFGQVASLCLGCVGVFDNPESRSAAELVLTRLATNAPARPPVFYLLGQLREEQQDYQKAYAEYKKAVSLDPDYLDVWEQINGLHDRIELPVSEWNAIQLRLLRMDPFERHICLRTDTLTDLKGFWATRTESLKLNLAQAENLLPLGGNIAELDKLSAAQKDTRMRRMGYRYHATRTAELPPPGESLAKIPIFYQLDSIQSNLGLSRKAGRSGGYYSDSFGLF